MLDFDFFELLDAVTIARSRKHIQTFYDTTDIGAFPQRRKPQSRSASRSRTARSAGFNEIFEQLQRLKLAVYAPLGYVFPSRMEKYEEMYDIEVGRQPWEPRAGRPRARPPEAHDDQPPQAAGKLRGGLPPNARGGPTQAGHAYAIAAFDAHDGALPRHRRIVLQTLDADDDDFEFPEADHASASRFKISLADMDYRVVAQRSRQGPSHCAR